MFYFYFNFCFIFIVLMCLLLNIGKEMSLPRFRKTRTLSPCSENGSVSSPLQLTVRLFVVFSITYCHINGFHFKI